MITGQEIQPDRTAKWDAKLLKIPPVSPSISNCTLIKIEYFVKIFLDIPGAIDLSIDLPIVIGTVPLRHTADVATSTVTILHSITESSFPSTSSSFPSTSFYPDDR